MMQRLLLVGMNHATAPLPVREKCAFSVEQRAQALRMLREEFPETEAVLISTCNRVELYIARPVHSNPRLEQVTSFLAKFHGMDEGVLRPHLYSKANRAVLDHLFTVAASLDSLVVGETQILGQVREAYEAAGYVGTVGTLLHPLFQRAIATAKEVMAQTALGEGRRSIASIAVDYARQVFEDFGDKNILSIGAGKMSTLVLTHLAQLQTRKLVVCNRDPLKAQMLATRFGGTSSGMDDLEGLLADADIVVSSTASTLPIITRGMFETVMKRRRWRPAFLIDIALPRDVEESVGDIDNVYLYNIDDLQQVASATDSARQEAVTAAEKLVQQRIDEFVIWNRTREVGPLIEKLFSRSHAIAHEEVQRTIGKLNGITDPEKQHLDDLARRIVNKLLHDPIHMIREGDPATGNNPYTHALAKLFKLDVEDEKDQGVD